MNGPHLAVAHPWLLWLLPLALLWLFAPLLPSWRYTSFYLLPAQGSAQPLIMALKGLRSAAVALILLGLSGPHWSAYEQEQVASGAQIVLLVDRSSSMDRPFGGEQLRHWSASKESKGQVARRLLQAFVTDRQRRDHADHFAMVIFSTNPIVALPFTTKSALVQAAIAAGQRGRGLAQTDLGIGLLQSLALFAAQPFAGSRLILLVSDGTAELAPDQQRRIRALAEQERVSLYWIYLRNPNGPSLASPDGAAASPEQRLHAFFSTLDTPYRAYAADHPSAMAQAIAAIDRRQTLPLRQQLRVPPQPLSGWCYGGALLCVGALLLCHIALRSPIAPGEPT